MVLCNHSFTAHNVLIMNNSSFIVECTSVQVSWQVLLKLFSNIVFVLIGKVLLYSSYFFAGLGGGIIFVFFVVEWDLQKLLI